MTAAVSTVTAVAATAATVTTVAAVAAAVSATVATTVSAEVSTAVASTVSTVAATIPAKFARRESSGGHAAQHSAALRGLVYGAGANWPGGGGGSPTAVVSPGVARDSLPVTQRI